MTKSANSPSTSPPRKKHEGSKEAKVDVDVEMIVLDSDPEDEMMDLEIETTSMISTLLENRIKQLEAQIAMMEEQKKNDDMIKTILEEDINRLKTNIPVEKYPNHLHQVQQKHVPHLNGFKLVYKTNPNGACFDECVAVHVYEDKDETSKVKRRINNHVADNRDSYYKNKIPLPYIETVGVGAHANDVVKNTRDEMIEFLRSDEAFMVYSNSQQLLAVANLFNISIRIFTYSGNQWR